jgi:hypothetical protein
MDAKFPYVYVNHDGTARELSPDERKYLQTEFAPGDGNRPYIKGTYRSRDGRGLMSGFIDRSRLPEDVEVRRVNPRFDDIVKDNYAHPVEESIRESEKVGIIVTRLPDGSVAHDPDPAIPQDELRRRLRQVWLEDQQKREEWAKHPDDRE